MMLHTAKSLGVVIIAVALFTACSEALVSQVGGEFDKAAGECEVCEHCESGTELVNKEPESKEAGEEATAADTTEEGASEDSAEKDSLEESEIKDDSVEAGNESDSKEVSEEETKTN